MKKTVIFLLALLLAIPALAVPALRGTYKFTQPDGTVILLQNHGDEYYNWKTDASGQTVALDADGFYRPVNISASEQRSRAARARARANASSWSSYTNPPATNFGDRKVLCILANFTDMTFTYDKQHFVDMLNEVGYNENGAIGSVRDYYVDNSGNQYRPQFDVYGPVTLSHESAYYDKNNYHGYRVSDAIKEAYEQLKNEIKISDYDTDNNGTVDMVLFYYPGYNEAEHGPENTIWPHQSTGNFGYLGGKQFNRYFCTSEFRGNSGAEPASIGTTCHEFAHSLGLPDFYDTDKEENEQNDITTEDFDLMSSGNYNDNGRRPPYLSALERNMLGWMADPVTINAAGSYVLDAIQNTQNTQNARAYRIDSQNSGEYFLLECRNGNKWDSFLGSQGGSGLLVYHVDKSSNSVPSSGQTAAYLWENTNKINAYGGHPCYYLVAHTDNVSLYSDFVLPGTEELSSYAPTDWHGYTAPFVLTGIAFDGSKVTFNIPATGTKTVDGFVKDAHGDAVSGATVTLSPSPYEYSAATRLSTDLVCTTGADGYYSFTLASTASQYQVISVRKSGYIPQACNLLVTERVNPLNFVMIQTGQEPPAALKKYSDDFEITSANLGTGDLAAGVRYTAEELAGAGAVGAKISDVSFLVEADSGQEVYLIVQIGSDRSLFNVTDGYASGSFLTVDLSELELTIPANQDVYLGVGLTNIPQSSYPFKMDKTEQDVDGTYRLTNFLSNSASWHKISFSVNYAFLISANISRVSETTFSTFGVSFIKLENGVPQVVPAAGKTVQGTAWSLDGTALEGEPTAATVSGLAPGAHTFMARLTYYDGTFERVYYDMIKE